MATICGVGCSTSARPVSRSPHTTLSTPGGSNSWAISRQQRRGRGGGVRGLEHHGVAGRQCRRDLPDHHQQRVVPRRHLADDADRLAPHPRGVVGHVLTGGGALQQPRGTGEEPEVVRGVGHLLLHGHLSGLPVSLHSTALISSIAVLDGVGDLEQRVGAVLRGGVPPPVERGVGGGVRPVDVLGPRPRRGRVDLAGGRVDDVVGLPRHPVDELAVDHVAELGPVRRSHGGTVVRRQRNR